VKSLFELFRIAYCERPQCSLAVCAHYNCNPLWPLIATPEHEAVCSRASVDDKRRSFVNVAVVPSSLVTCGLRTRMSTNADLQDFVRTQTDADPVP